MKSWRVLALLAIAAGIVLAGCATTAAPQPGAAGREALFPFPPQPPQSLRLIIYRPQLLVGMWGKPVIIVNGQRMGNPGSPVTDNPLLPGTVFVVDAPASGTRVGWAQSGRDAALDETIAYAGLAGARRYLRWTLAPTYGHIVEVDEAHAVEEIGALRFSAYIDLVSGR